MFLEIYANISNKKLKNEAIIGYVAAVVLVPVLYYLAGITDTKSIVIYVIGIVILPGVMMLANWLQFRHEPSVSASHVIKDIMVNEAVIREKLDMISQKKKWRLADQGENWIKLETPVSFTSYGEYITIEFGENEITISSTPKVSSSHIVITSSDNGEAISKIIHAA